MNNLLPYIDTGDRGKPVLVFLAGFPDNQTSGWGKSLTQKLANNYRLVFLCLPDYQIGNKAFRPWGYKFNEILNLMFITVKSLKILESGKFDLIVHDWGAVIGQKYQNTFPEQVRKMVILDVAMIRPNNVSIKWKLRLMAYQIIWGIFYIISQAVSFHLAEALFQISIRPPVVWLGPMPEEELRIPWKDLTVAKCYPYYYLLLDHIGLADAGWTNTSFPTCPILYMV